MDRFHRWLVMPASVLVATRGHVDDVQFVAGKHLSEAVMRWDGVLGSGLVRSLPSNVAHGNQLGQAVFLVALRVNVADSAHPNQSDSQSHYFSFAFAAFA